MPSNLIEESSRMEYISAFYFVKISSTDFFVTFFKLAADLEI